MLRIWCERKFKQSFRKEFVRFYRIPLFVPGPVFAQDANAELIFRYINLFGFKILRQIQFIRLFVFKYAAPLYDVSISVITEKLKLIHQLLNDGIDREPRKHHD